MCVCVYVQVHAGGEALDGESVKLTGILSVANPSASRGVLSMDGANIDVRQATRVCVCVYAQCLDGYTIVCACL